MPGRIVVVHDDPAFSQSVTRAMRRAAIISRFLFFSRQQVNSIAFYYRTLPLRVMTNWRNKPARPERIRSRQLGIIADSRPAGC